MASDPIRQLLQQGIAAAKSGDAETARKFIQQALKLDPQNEVGWLALLSVTAEPKDRLRILKRVLEINPQNERAIEILKKMGIAPAKLLGATVQPPSQAPAPESPSRQLPPSQTPLKPKTGDPPVAPPAMDSLRSMMTADEDEEEDFAAPRIQWGDDEDDEPAPTPSVMDDDVAPVFALGERPNEGSYGVPVPDARRLQEMGRLADEIAQTYLAETPESNVQWARKEKRRAGERDIWVLRFQITTAVVSFLTIIGVAGAVFVANSPEAQEALFGPTLPPPSLTPTFTLTPTPTIGITPTFSPTPELTYTPSPTLDPSVTPQPTNQPARATALYSPDGAVVGPRIEDAAELIALGNYDEAIPLLQAERQAAPNYPYPYYYLAKISLLRDDPTGALTILQEGETAVGNAREDLNYRPIINLGFAELALYQAQRVINAGRPGDARQFFTEIDRRIEIANKPNRNDIALQDPRLIEAYLVLAKRFELADDADRALTVLNQGLLFSPQAFTNMQLRVEKIRLYFGRGDYDTAIQESNDAIYINAFTPEAHRLRIQAALAKNDPGLGVLFSEAYLFFYPGSVEGYKLLGDARRAENKSDLALNSYTRGLLGNPEDPNYIEAILARAELYQSQGRYEAALDDYTSALELRDDPQVRALRMFAAYQSGEYALAQEDAGILFDSGIVPNGQIQLIQARILVDEAGPNDTGDFEQALNLLTNAVNNGLPPEQAPIADEYLARVNYELENADAALNSINRAMNAGETGTRHYLRGLILEAQGNFVEARNDYEWVLTWSTVFPYDFVTDAQQRYDNLTDILTAEPTPEGGG